MAAQFVPAPGPGSAPRAPQPASPRGLYRQFGAPERLLRIHFPTDPNKDPATANPWYWYLDFQQPFAFSFLKSQWVRLPDFGIIKILDIDSQVLTPIPPVGHKSLDAAARNPQQADASWGRLDFRDNHFWDLIVQNGNQNKGGPKAKPKFNVEKGVLKAQDTKTNINAIIKAAATRWQDDWNGEAATYNKIAAGVGPNGFHYPGQPALFSVPIPDGPPTTLSRFAAQLNAFTANPPGNGAAYLGPIPGTALFNINTFTTSAYAFTLKVGQLDPKVWNMSVFPPLDATLIGNGTASALSKDYSGFGKTPFLLAGPDLG